MENIFEIDINKRYSCSRLLAHPFLKVKTINLSDSNVNDQSFGNSNLTYKKTISLSKFFLSNLNENKNKFLKPQKALKKINFISAISNKIKSHGEIKELKTSMSKNSSQIMEDKRREFENLMIEEFGKFNTKQSYSYSSEESQEKIDDKIINLK